MSTTFITLTETTCGACGVPFAMPDYMLEAKRRDGDSFYCPNGHCRAFKKTEAQKERERADKLADELARANTRALHEKLARESAERSAAAYKGQATKARRRAAAALCPCCNRSFVQLRRHLEAKHPNYKIEENA